MWQGVLVFQKNKLSNNFKKSHGGRKKAGEFFTMVMHSTTVGAQKLAGHKFSFKKKISFKTSSSSKSVKKTKISKKVSLKKKAKSKA